MMIVYNGHQLSNTKIVQMMAEDYEALIAEKSRLEEIVQALAHNSLANDQRSENDKRILELCKKYDIEPTYWTSGGLVQSDTLQKIAYAALYYEDARGENQ